MASSTHKGNSSPEQTTHAGHWHMYWKGISGANQPVRGGATDPVFTEFWTQFFARELSGERPARVLDLACGDGAVTQTAVSAGQKLGSGEITPYCLDYSRFAVLETLKQFSNTLGVSADAAQMPFISEAFDIVASQFGLEYADPGAIREVARTLAKSGLLVCVLHKRDGALYKECHLELTATQELQDSQIMELANNHFGAFFRMISGSGSRPEFEATWRLLTPAVRRVENMIRTRGQHAAGGLIYIIYQKLAWMNEHLRENSPESIETWMKQMDEELEAYSGRMISMLNAALGEQQFKALTDKLTSEGLIVESSGILCMARNREAVAWTLVCRKV
jgi:SAM-dependent methyltransferase